MFNALWFNRKLRSWALQLFLIGAFTGGCVWLFVNAQENLTARGITAGYGFLDQPARFPISESLMEYTPEDSFGRAFMVGLTNTVFIASVIIVVSTLLGLVLALARRSTHPLLKGSASVYIEAARNVPLVVQLLFWYSLVTVNLPGAREAFSPMPNVFLTLRGLFLPKPELSGQVALLWAVIALSVVSITIAAVLQRRKRILTGNAPRLVRMSVAASAVPIVLACWSGDVLISWDVPKLEGFNFVGGTALTPEFLALMAGLVIYSTAFIGEVIRGGIDSVPKGQWEAGDALGLSRTRTLRLIVFPQALRVIVPPMTSQYLSLTKNTTLALAVGYPDIAFVVATTINQTGQAVEGILILMAVFLSLSLAISILMNWYNRRIGLVQC